MEARKTQVATDTGTRNRPVLKELLYAYSVISRARRYAGMAGVPLPLSLTEINEYLATHPVLIERDEFEAVIFALDDQYFQEQCV